MLSMVQARVGFQGREVSTTNALSPSPEGESTGPGVSLRDARRDVWSLGSTCGLTPLSVSALRAAPRRQAGISSQIQAGAGPESAVEPGISSLFSALPACDLRGAFLEKQSLTCPWYVLFWLQSGQLPPESCWCRRQK